MEMIKKASVSGKRSMREEMVKSRCRLVAELEKFETLYVLLESNARKEKRELSNEELAEMNCLLNKVTILQDLKTKIDSILGCLKPLPLKENTLKNKLAADGSISGPSSANETSAATGSELSTTDNTVDENILKSITSAIRKVADSNVLHIESVKRTDSERSTSSLVPYTASEDSGVAESLQSGDLALDGQNSSQIASADSLVSNSNGVSVPPKIANLQTSKNSEISAADKTLEPDPHVSPTADIADAQKNIDAHISDVTIKLEGIAASLVAGYVTDSSKIPSCLSDGNVVLEKPDVGVSIGGHETELLENTKSSAVVVRRQSVLEVDETEDELEYRRMSKITLIPREHLKCTKCRKHLTPGNRHLHPLLKVLFCSACKNYYCDGEFSPDEEGDDKYCRWCGQWESLLFCAQCNYAFCTECIKWNLGDAVRQLAEEDDEWQCFVCNPWPLWELRHIAAIAMKSPEQHVADAENVEKQTRKNSEAGPIKFKKNKTRGSTQDGGNESLGSDEDLNKTENLAISEKIGKKRKRLQSDSSSEGDEYRRNEERFSKSRTLRSDIVQRFRYGLRRRSSYVDNKSAHENRYKLRKRRRSCSSNSDAESEKKLCGEEGRKLEGETSRNDNKDGQLSGEGCDEESRRSLSKEVRLLCEASNDDDKDGQLSGEGCDEESSRRSPGKEVRSICEASNDEVRNKSNSSCSHIADDGSPGNVSETESSVGGEGAMSTESESSYSDEEGGSSVGKQNRRSKRLHHYNSEATHYYNTSGDSEETASCSETTWSVEESETSSEGEIEMPRLNQRCEKELAIAKKINKYRTPEVQCGSNEYLRPFLNLSALTSDLVAEMCIKKLQKISQQSRVCNNVLTKIEKYLSILTGGVSILRKTVRESPVEMSNEEV